MIEATIIILSGVVLNEQMFHLRQLYYKWGISATQTGGRVTPTDCDESCIHNIIPRTTTRKAIQRDNSTTL